MDTNGWDGLSLTGCGWRTTDSVKLWKELAWRTWSSPRGRRYEQLTADTWGDSRCVGCDSREQTGPGRGGGKGFQILVRSGFLRQDRMDAFFLLEASQAAAEVRAKYQGTGELGTLLILCSCKVGSARTTFNLRNQPRQLLNSVEIIHNFKNQTMWVPIQTPLEAIGNNWGHWRWES